MAKKALYQDPYYVELAGSDADAPRPGAFFYAPVLFDANILATVRPVEDEVGRPAVRGGHLVFDVQLPLAEDAFRRPTSIPPNIKPYEELVAVPGKMRPVVILSPEAGNGDSFLAVPSFKAANFPAHFLDAARHGDSLECFYLPACPALNQLESLLDFRKIQPIRRSPKMVNPGNRHHSDSERRFLRLSDDYFAELREALAEYLGIPN